MVYRPIDKSIQEVPVSNVFAAISQVLGSIDTRGMSQNVRTLNTEALVDNLNPK